MSAQVQGIAGAAVDRMIRLAVHRSFRNVYWIPPVKPISEPAIFVPNHHGWHDGYLMYLALSALRLHGFHDWIQEFDAFPLFGKIGGMPFPENDPMRRAATIRRTIRLMRQEQRSLLLFAEGVLHRPPKLLPFGKSLSTIATHVPNASVVPVAIRYEHNIHERPEAYILFGDAIPTPTPIAGKPNELPAHTRLVVAALLDRIAATLTVEPETFRILHRGTPDVNERWDMRKIPGFVRRGKSLP